MKSKLKEAANMEEKTLGKQLMNFMARNMDYISVFFLLGLFLFTGLATLQQTRNQKTFVQPALTALKKSTQVVEMKINPEHYEADSCIVCCIDDRFTPMIDNFAQNGGYKKVDYIKVAGGSKDFAKDASGLGALNVADYLCKQIAKSIALHSTKRVDIMVHVGCGAYGGTTDEDFYLSELAKAKSSIEAYLQKNEGLSVKIHTYLATYEGLYEAN